MSQKVKLGLYCTGRQSSEGFIHAHKHQGQGEETRQNHHGTAQQELEKEHKITKYREFHLNVTLLPREAEEPPFLRTFKPQLGAALSEWLRSLCFNSGLKLPGVPSHPSCPVIPAQGRLCSELTACSFARLVKQGRSTVTPPLERLLYFVLMTT